ncbi:MAG: futalosine hydrolase [Flavobacteriales bacterium]|nr:futalosine hydrolase [Flavobacteriales bacterium]
MNILIAVATKEEVKLLMAELESLDNGYVVNEHNVHVLVTGVGMVATTYHLTTIFSSDTSYDLILNIGIAGSFTNDLDLGTVTQVTTDQIADFGAEDGKNFISAADLGFIDEEDAVLHNVSDFGNEVIDSLVQVDGMTVNSVHGDEDSIAKVKASSNVQVETMEGAAFFYVCKKEMQACAQIRSISNYVEKRDKGKWELELAFKNLATVTLDILKAL